MNRWRNLLQPALMLCLGVIVPVFVRAAPTLGPWIPRFKGIDSLTATNFLRSTDFDTLMVANALRINLLDPDIHFLSTPRITNFQANVRETAGRTVSRFLKVNRLQVAVNAGFFSPGEYYLADGTPMVVAGLLISGGTQVSPANASYAATVLIDAGNHAQIIPKNWPIVSTNGAQTAVSGDYTVLVGGVNVGRQYLNQGGNHDRNPRTAIGISGDGHYLYLLAIDGRQAGYSNGAYDYETAAWLSLLGARDGVNMDGGGSTTMVMEDSTGNPRRLNHPSAVSDSGKERTVGSHLGVFAKPLAGFINDIVALPDDDAATITWTSIAPATTQVEYGLTEDLGLTTALLDNAVTNHAALLTGLQPGTGYYFRPVSVQGGIRYASSNQFFTTTNYLSTNVVIALTDPWKFSSANLDGVDWTATDYDDSSWGGPGPGLFWADSRSTGPNPEIQPKGTELPIDAGTVFPFTAYNFRTHFELAGAASGAAMLFSGYIDDGAIIYLNGHEIYRLRMEESPTPILNDDVSISFPCEGDATCRDEFAVGGDLGNYLRVGDNVIAVEVHNYNRRSPDITFGLEIIDAQPKVVPAMLTISGTDGTSTLSWNRGGFTLQQADSPDGPWSDVPGPVVASPFATDEKGVARYYRIRK